MDELKDARRWDVFIVGDAETRKLFDVTILYAMQAQAPDDQQLNFAITAFLERVKTRLNRAVTEHEVDLFVKYLHAHSKLAALYELPTWTPLSLRFLGEHT